MQAPSEEDFHSVSLLFSFRLFVPNRPLFSVLILLFSAETPEGTPCGSMCGIPNYREQTGQHKFMCMCYSRHVWLCVCVCVLPWVHASALLTCSVALHLNDTFGFLAHLPGVEGPNSNSDFYRRPRHICGFWLIPSKIPCISLLKETGKQKKRCLHPFYKNVFVLNN